MSTSTPGQMIREKCIDCLGVINGRGAFDCIGESCPLYPAMPWRGKVLALQEQDALYLKQVEQLAKRVPTRRAGKNLIRQMCYACQEGREDCLADCPLRPLTPFQPGGQPKRRYTEDKLQQMRERAKNVLSGGAH